MPASLAGFAHPEFLVETDWLAAHLGQSDLRIIDCTVHIVFDPVATFTITSGLEDFARGHIPGAKFVDVVSELSDSTDPVPCMAPSAAQFASVMRQLGVGNDSRVVLYSAQNPYWATRVWWLFRTYGFDNAAILNGGWQKWRREARPNETGPARPRRRSRFVVREERALMATKAEVLAAIGDRAVCTINALPEDQHLFTSGIHYGRPGHITGSINIPSEDLLNPDTNEFLPAAELRQRFERAGAFKTRVITYCGGGIAASADAMALVMLGHPDVKLYDGSLCEWAADPSLPMEAAPIPTSSDQAIVAIENRQLLTELREALDQQTATAEILQVINSSPGNLAPVFDAMLDKALRLCGAAFGFLNTYDGERFQIAATRGVPAAWAEYLTATPDQPGRGGGQLRVLRGERFVQFADMKDDEAYRDGTNPAHRAMVDLGGARTGLVVPLRQDDALVGTFTIYRQEVRPFSDKQIALLQNFAAQVMLEKATRLCGALFGILWTYDGQRFRAQALHRIPPALAEFLRDPIAPAPGGGVFEQLVRGEPVAHAVDMMNSESYRTGASALRRAFVDIGGAQTGLLVALRKDNTLLGAIQFYRQEPRPFTDKQIALLQSFAAQAVIAMENARLLGELRARTDEIAGWNRDLEARVAAQLAEIERTGKLRRFLAPQLADLIVAQGDDSILESHRREIVVVFCDLRGFTGFAERAEPEEVMALLRDYHAALGPIVASFEGTLDHYAGDGIMVFFNDPLPCPEPARRAIEMAVAMREAAAALLQTWRRHGHAMGFGVGISQGYATLGQIGFAERMDYTAIGTVTNLAARLCGEAKDGQILVSRRVATAVEDTAALEEIGDLSLKGLGQAVAVYNVVAVSAEASAS